jgi:hypothetical protein
MATIQEQRKTLLTQADSAEKMILRVYEAELSSLPEQPSLEQLQTLLQRIEAAKKTTRGSIVALTSVLPSPLQEAIEFDAADKARDRDSFNESGLRRYKERSKIPTAAEKDSIKTLRKILECVTDIRRLCAKVRVVVENKTLWEEVAAIEAKKKASKKKKTDSGSSVLDRKSDSKPGDTGDILSGGDVDFETDDELDLHEDLDDPDDATIVGGADDDEVDFLELPKD